MRPLERIIQLKKLSDDDDTQESDDTHLGQFGPEKKKTELSPEEIEEIPPKETQTQEQDQPPASTGDGSRNSKKSLKSSPPLDEHKINELMADIPGYLGTITKDEIPKLTKAAKKAWLAGIPFGWIHLTISRAQAVGNNERPGEVGHWVAVAVVPGRGAVMYYDSFGRPAPADVKTMLKTLFDKVAPREFLKFKENLIQEQSVNTNNCGWFSIKFLLDIFGGMEFTDTTPWNPALTDPGASNAPWETIVDVVGSGDLASQVRFQNTTDSTSISTGAVRFYGGVGIAKTLHAKDIMAGTLNIDGSAITPGNYVTLDSAQGITGNKAFSGQVKFSGSLEVGPSGEYDLTTMPWQYLQNVDQNLQTTAAPEFANMWITGAPFSVRHVLGWLDQEVKTGSTPQFAGLQVTGDITTDSLTATGTINSTTVNTGTLTVNDVEVTPNKYVTTDTNQYIGGVKTFGFDLLPAGTSVNVGRSTNIFGVVFSNSVRTKHIRLGSSILPTNDYPAPPSAVNIGSAEDPFNVVYANDVKISGQSVVPTNYVNLDTEQTVSGKKTFSQDVNIGTTNFGRLRLSTYGGGDSFINGGYTSDADYFLELWARGRRLFDIRNGYWDGPTEHWGPRRVNFYANNITFHSIGTGRSGLQYSGSTTQMYIHSDGDGISQLSFGQDGNDSGNRTWVLSSRSSSENRDFIFFRGPKLAGSWQEVIRVSSSNAQVKFSRTEDSSSTTTGAVTFTGGVGIAKTLHAKDIVADSLIVNGMPMYRQARKNDTLYTLNIGTYNTSTTPDIHMVRIGNQITLTFRLVTFTIASGQPTLLSMHMAIPEIFRPQHLMTHAMFLTVNNAYPIQAMCTIDNIGNINITPIPQVYYTGATNRVEPFSSTYCHYAA